MNYQLIKDNIFLSVFIDRSMKGLESLTSEYTPLIHSINDFLKLFSIIME